MGGAFEQMPPRDFPARLWATCGKRCVDTALAAGTVGGKHGDQSEGEGVLWKRSCSE